MINIRAENHRILCDISDEIKIDPKYFPLKFRITKLVTEEILWETELYPNTWATWGGVRDINAWVLTNNGIILKEFKYEYSRENLQIYEFYDYFCRINKNSTGLILGAGNGTWGEWVIPVHREHVYCHLVEGSETTFEQLKKAYHQNNNFKIHNLIVTSDGRDCEFYEGDHDSGLNTINREYLKITDVTSSPSYKIKPSKSIVHLLEEIGKIDWIRMDLEGADFEVITSIPKDILSSLIMIQYEHLGLSSEKRDHIDSLMSPLNFRKIQYDIDTIYVK
jgi:FkbM family methyltransferase